MKSDFEFTTDAQGEAYMDEIADDSERLLGIRRTEAIGRINRQWRGQAITGELHLIDHEDTGHGANDIYYGPDTAWWQNPPGLIPRPFP